jgi:hypothetical protein
MSEKFEGWTLAEKFKYIIDTIVDAGVMEASFDALTLVSPAGLLLSLDYKRQWGGWNWVLTHLSFDKKDRRRTFFNIILRNMEYPKAITYCIGKIEEGVTKIEIASSPYPMLYIRIKMEGDTMYTISLDAEKMRDVYEKLRDEGLLPDFKTTKPMEVKENE